MTYNKIDRVELGYLFLSLLFLCGRSLHSFLLVSFLYMCSQILRTVCLYLSCIVIISIVRLPILAFPYGQILAPLWYIVYNMLKDI